MRAVDGVIVVVDPVEGIMPQTETVMRQALKEKAKPVLFINKVDRLLTELRLTPEQTFERLLKLINDVNKLINGYAPEEFVGKWNVSVENGSVCIGSAAKKWAISKRIMEKYNTSFKEIFALTAAGDEKRLQEVAPIDEATLTMIIEHLPTPRVAQAYRIPHLWHGDLESAEGKAMTSVDAKAPAGVVIFGISYDPHGGEVAVGRVFSGTIRKGTMVYISGKNDMQKILQVGLYMGPERVLIDQVSAGNIAAIIGLKDLSIGDTISETNITPFEQITHYSKPVVTKAVEAKELKDTLKLIEALRELSKSDPTLQVEIKQETGEHLMSGMGELHLEVIETKLRDNYKIPITTSEPLVVYKETIDKETKDVEGKSPNHHTRFDVTISPLEKGVIDLIETGVIRDGEPKGKIYLEELVKAGMPREEARGLVDVSHTSVLIDATHGVQYMNEVMELLIDGFEEAVTEGPLAKEKCFGVKVLITDATIHEDPVHRGPAQVMPAIRRPIWAGMLFSGVNLLEPKQKFTVNIPQEYLSDVIGLLQARRGQVQEIQQENEQVTIIAKMPVAEVIKGFSNEIRGATTGRAIWSTEFDGYEKIPKEIQDKIVREIRKRKGQKEEPPSPQDFMD
ncbi:Elongation factor 2 [uncultured archaeon]|nr:Elongation factor 2 [uncultured archaeon]